VSDNCAGRNENRLSPERYETIFETIRDGVYTLDETGRITWVNDVVLNDLDLGYSQPELVGRHVRNLLSNEDFETCQAIIGDLLARNDRESGRCEVDLQTAHGTTIPVELHLTLLPAPEGEFRGTVGVLREITHRKQREQWLKVLNRLLRHNLRNQLNIISGRIEMLEAEVTSDGHQHISAINDSIQDLVRLSEKTVEVHNALMDVDGANETVDAAELVTTVCQEYRLQRSALDLSVDVPEAAWVRADYTLSFVIENLLENAIEHTNNDVPTIGVSISSETTDGDNWVEIRFADAGPGIPPVELNAVVSGEVTPLRHGSGLGLWLVKWLVERHGGDIIFTERDPRGSIITIRLQPAEPTTDQ